MNKSFTWLETLALGLGFCILWSSAFAVGKLAVGNAPPLFFLSVRFLIATLAMLVVLKLMGIKIISSWREFNIGSMLGILNNASYLGLCWTAFQTTSAGMVAIIVGLSPLITALIAHFWLKEALGLRRIIGLALGLGGAWWVIVARLDGGLVIDSQLGIILSFIAMFSLSLGTLVYRRYGSETGNNPWRLNMLQSFSAGIILIPFAAFEPWQNIIITPIMIWLMIYLVIVISILGLLMWFTLIRRIGAAGASALHFLNPALALLFAWVMLGETVQISEIFGVVPILLGILLVNWPTKNKATKL